MESRFRKVLNILSVVWMLGATLLGLAPLQEAAAEEEIKIGLVQYVEHMALDAVREGFVDRLNESSYKDRIKWDLQNANGDLSSLQSIAEKTARENDILFAIATPAAQGMAAVENQKPIFFAAVTDPVEAELVKSIEEPGTNLTGTSDLAAIPEQVALLIENFPEAKNVGIIYNSSEVNSQVLAKSATDELEKADLKVEQATITSTNDIQQVLNALLPKIDVLFLVTDNTIDSAITLVGDLAKEAKIPTVGSSDAVVKLNGLMTLSNSYYDYGQQTADMVIRMLDEDLDPSQMPVEYGQNLEIIVNEDYAKAIGLDPKDFKLPDLKQE